jgi:hypothetical protein
MSVIRITKQKYIDVIKTVVYLMKNPALIKSLHEQDPVFMQKMLKAFFQVDWAYHQGSAGSIEQAWRDVEGSLSEIAGDVTLHF